MSVSMPPSPHTTMSTREQTLECRVKTNASAAGIDRLICIGAPPVNTSMHKAPSCLSMRLDGWIDRSIDRFMSCGRGIAGPLACTCTHNSKSNKQTHTQTENETTTRIAIFGFALSSFFPASIISVPLLLAMQGSAVQCPRRRCRLSVGRPAPLPAPALCRCYACVCMLCSVHYHYCF
jgi:hypothetical protein